MRVVPSPDGESRVYHDAGKVHVVNLTPAVAGWLADIGLEPAGTVGFVPLPPRPRRCELDQVDVPEAVISKLFLDELWALHDDPGGSCGATSRLRVKLELARRLSEPCNLCQHRCGADRDRGEGWCGAPLQPSRIDPVLHVGEEIAGPTLCLYLGPGCSHRCRFCTFHALVEGARGDPIDVHRVACALDIWKARGARSLTMIGGEPGIYVPWIFELLVHEHELPLVWNSNMYHTPEVGRLLDGVVDVYIADFKFGNDACARRLAGLPQYVELVLSNIVTASSQADTIVRHVVMPGHLDCCARLVLDRLAAVVPGIAIHLLRYIPEHLGPRYGLDRFTRDDEIDAIQAHGESAGLQVWV